MTVELHQRQQSVTSCRGNNQLQAAEASSQRQAESILTFHKVRCWHLRYPEPFKRICYADEITVWTSGVNSGTGTRRCSISYGSTRY